MLGRAVLIIVGLNAALGVAAFFAGRAAIRRMAWTIFGKEPPKDEEEHNERS